MKKYLLPATALMLIVAIFIIGRRSNRGAEESPSTATVAQPDTLATRQFTHEPNSQVVAVPKLAAGGIPLIDEKNPAFAVPLVLLESRFLRSLEQEAAASSLSPEQLVLLSHQLAVLRLSQTTHEATIAKVTASKDGVLISVPAYRLEGEYLKSQVLDKLLGEFKEKNFRDVLATQFGFYGQRPQLIEIGSKPLLVDGEERYTFIHEYLDINGTGSVKTISRLAAYRFGPYAPYAGWILKS